MLRYLKWKEHVDLENLFGKHLVKILVQALINYASSVFSLLDGDFLGSWLLSGDLFDGLLDNFLRGGLLGDFLAYSFFGSG